MKKTIYSLMTLAALALALSPRLALAQGNPLTSGRSHASSTHDRTPHAHDHTPVARH